MELSDSSAVPADDTNIGSDGVPITFDLIIDELGFVPLSPTGAELLFEVFSHHVHILEMNGDSYRLRHNRQGRCFPSLG